MGSDARPRLRVYGLKSKWIKIYAEKPDCAYRLFCFPYAGSGASVFREWADFVPADVEVCAVQPPGRESRFSDPPIADLQEFVNAILPEIMPFLDKPFAFFGHSMGALMGFELSRALRRKDGKVPFHLFLSAQRAPQVLDRAPATRNLSNDDILETLRELGGTPSEALASPQLMQLILPRLRADFEMCFNYAPTLDEPLATRMSVFGGERDTGVTHESLMGWSAHATGRFSLDILPGDHFFIHSAQQPLIKLVSSSLMQDVRDGWHSGARRAENGEIRA